MEKIQEKRKQYLIEKSRDLEKELELSQVEFSVFSIEKKTLEKLGKGLQFLRDLAVLSTLFVRKDSKYFDDKKVIDFIEQNLKKFLEKIYNENEGEYGNWWHWEIGYPLEIVDILLLLDGKLDSNLVKRALEVTKFFQPDPQYSGMNPRAIHPRMPALRITTGGNRVDTVKVSLIRGILLKDLSEVKRAISVLPEVWRTKSSILKDDGESRDGFYEDGSFLQHGSIPYTGTYGNVLLKGVAEILFILNGSFLEEELKNVEEMYENVLKAFEPLFFKGGISDFVSGRAIARKDHWDQKIGCEILKSITLLSKSASPKYKKVFLKIIERETDKKEKYKREIYCFNAMERVFLRDRNHAFGIALHSKKIGNYESMNGENTQGWFTGDGAYYIYNEDTEQYKNYWNNVDMRYIPGTTEVVMEMEGVDAQRNYETFHVENGWSKAIEKDGYAVVGMNFTNFTNELNSKKTWFLIPGAVIFLEDKIKSEKDCYATVLNRKLSGDEVILIDGEEMTEMCYFRSIKEIVIDELLYKIKNNPIVKIERDNGFLKVTIPLKAHLLEKKISWEIVYDPIQYCKNKDSFCLKIKNGEHILENKNMILSNNWEKKLLNIYSKIVF